MVAVTGNTYPVKDQLKALGARWDADRKAWMIDESKADEARKIVSGAPVATTISGKCRKCGRECKAPYTMCYTCSMASQGKCVNCGGSLSDWERRHGVKRCADCRDGGSRAHGGQSYYDRHGRFVLGDDD